MIVRTNLLRRTVRALYRSTSLQALDDPTATIDQLENRAHKIRRQYRNDLESIQNVETIARSYR